MEKFTVYKGLQAPLVFKGFKGRYIYWGIGTIIAALVIGVFTLTLVSSLVGIIVIVLILAGGLTYTFKKQSRSLYNIRDDNRKIFLVRKKEIFKYEKKG